MARILILFAHPAMENSRIHKQMIYQVRNLEGITFHDLYEAYPDMDIDVAREKELLLNHDIIIWQHPFYWYSCPAIIKQWEDLVLEHGWAYGSGGTALTGKRIFNVISCGGSREVYSKTGRNRFTIRELLAPFDQTAFLCHMEYLPPFVVHGTFRLREPEIKIHAVRYAGLLKALLNDSVTADEWKQLDYFNDLSPISQLT